MPAEVDFQAERSELEAVLSSGVFARSPIVAQMLKYICETHFRGQSHDIKEYNIAVEAFGRPADFDQTRDSIVRVEAHRLRKRLQEFYNGTGAAHEIHIVIPPGSYVPRFIRRAEPAAPVADVQAPEIPASEAPLPAPEEEAKKGTPKIGWYAFLFTAAVVFIGVLVLAPMLHKKGAVAAPPKSAPVVEPVLLPDDEVRILAGTTTPKVVDHYGNTWLGDRYFEGGTVKSVSPRPIAYTRDASMFYRFREGDCSYDIPLKKGYYELRLYFAETVFGENNVAGGGETSRVFKVLANEKELLRFIDVVSDAGGSNTADIKVFKDVQPADDGKLHLKFVTISTQVPFINAIEIVPARQGAIRPIRILARDSSYVDQFNHIWSADRYFHNGMLVQRPDPVAATDDQTLYQSERFGNFSYAIPVALHSRYTVTMKFCEAWFGQDRPGGRGEDKRVFDISLNGRPLLASFEVLKEAGGLRALDKVFKGLEPNAQGKLIFSFTPSLNYAMVDAIEVVDEAWK
jgi:hypothetical protein